MVVNLRFMTTSRTPQGLALPGASAKAPSHTSVTHSGRLEALSRSDQANKKGRAAKAPPASLDARDLLAKIEPAVGAANGGGNPVARLKILRPALLRLQEQLPELALRQELNDASDRRRRQAQGAAGRSAGQQHVARGDIGESRQFGDGFRRLEHEIGRVVGLARDAVDGKAQVQPIDEGELLRLEHGQPRADRTEAAVALALEELHLRQLDVAGAEVVGDGDSEHVVCEIARSDCYGRSNRAAEHQRQFDFVIEQRDVAQTLHRPDRRADRGVGLGEEHVERLRVRIHARLDHVLAIVGALAEYAARRGDWREDAEIPHRKRRLPLPRLPPIGLPALYQVSGRWIVAGEWDDAFIQYDAPARSRAVLEANEIESHVV